MQEGTLDRLRDGKLSSTEAKGTSKTEKSSRQEVKKSIKPTRRTDSKPSEYDNRRERRAKGGSTMRHDHAPPDGDESDGGFFEE